MSFPQDNITNLKRDFVNLAQVSWGSTRKIGLGVKFGDGKNLETGDDEFRVYIVGTYDKAAGVGDWDINGVSKLEENLNMMCKENCENHPERGHVCSDEKCFDKGGTCVYQVPSNNPDDYMKPEQDQDQIQDEVVHQPEIFHEHPEVIDQEEPEFEVGGEGDFVDHVQTLGAGTDKQAIFLRFGPIN